jgi:hypothetical protein
MDGSMTVALGLSRANHNLLPHDLVHRPLFGQTLGKIGAGKAGGYLYEAVIG